jgi:hypothetical protein
VLLVRALVSWPGLLVLDNVYDGLNAGGRVGLRDVIERVLRGFRMDILVQGVGNAKDAARTQVLLLMHRPKEISDGFGRVTFLDGGKGGEGGRKRRGVRTKDRAGRTGEELVGLLVLGGAASKGGKDNAAAGSCPWDIVLPGRGGYPSNVDLKSFGECLGGLVCDATDPPKSKGGGDVLVRLHGLKVMRDDVTLISCLNWTVRQGKRWHLAGTNGRFISCQMLVRRFRPCNHSLFILCIIRVVFGKVLARAR